MTRQNSPLTTEEINRVVAYYVSQHRGEANAILRRDLVVHVFGEAALFNEAEFAKFDRRVRKSVERLRNDGQIICNMGNGEGYYEAETQAEYLAFRAVYGSHAFPILATIKQMDAAAEKRWAGVLQPSLF